MGEIYYSCWRYVEGCFLCGGCLWFVLGKLVMGYGAAVAVLSGGSWGGISVEVCFVASARRMESLCSCVIVGLVGLLVVGFWAVVAYCSLDVCFAFWLV